MLLILIEFSGDGYEWESKTAYIRVANRGIPWEITAKLLCCLKRPEKQNKWPRNKGPQQSAVSP